MATHLGVDPEWFEEHPIYWRDRAQIHLIVTSAIRAGFHGTHRKADGTKRET